MTKVTAADDPLRENELTVRGPAFYRPQTRMGGLMFAVDHSATALLIKRRFPSVSMTPLLVSVQAMELAWVALNYLGIEQTTTSATVRSVADIHLAYIPYSHSVATMAAAALVAWWVIERGFGRRALGRAVAIGIVSHLVLDIATHAPDIALWPGSPFGRLGLGLYSGAPSVAFVVELVYGVLCWWIYRGSRALLWVVVVGNLADLSFFFAGIPGPEQFLAGHAMLIVTLIFGQIIVMLVLVGLFASKQSALRNVPAQTACQYAAFHDDKEESGLAQSPEALGSGPERRFLNPGSYGLQVRSHRTRRICR